MLFFYCILVLFIYYGMYLFFYKNVFLILVYHLFTIYFSSNIYKIKCQNMYICVCVCVCVCVYIYIYIYISGGPLSALTCCVNVRLLSGDKKNIAVNLFSKLGWELGLYYANSQTAEIHGACGKAFRPSLTTSPRHRPVTTTHPSQMHSTTFIHGLKCRTTHLHKNCPHLPATRHSVCLQPT